MTGPAEQFAAILREQREQPDTIGEVVIAVRVGDVMPDGTPITPTNVGALMVDHEADLEELYGGGVE